MENYSKWKEEYEPNYLEDDDEMLHIKEAINKLNSIQKKLFLCYVELGSYAAVAREFNVCTITAKKYIKDIKEKIYNNL